MLDVGTHGKMSCLGFLDPKFWKKSNKMIRTSLIVLRSSGISHKAGLSQEKEWISFVFYCFENPSIAHNFGTTGLIKVEFSAKCTSPNMQFNQIENWKCHMFNFRLISLDRITIITWDMMLGFTISDDPSQESLELKPASLCHTLTIKCM